MQPLPQMILPLNTERGILMITLTVTLYLGPGSTSRAAPPPITPAVRATTDRRRPRPRWPRRRRSTLHRGGGQHHTSGTLPDVGQNHTWHIRSDVVSDSYHQSTNPRGWHIRNGVLILPADDGNLSRRGDHRPVLRLPPETNSPNRRHLEHPTYHHQPHTATETSRLCSGPNRYQQHPA